jgi:predicted Zn-dependent protease
LALKTPIWLATEHAYRTALEELIQVRAQKTVSAEEEDRSADFSEASPVRYLEPPVKLDWDAKLWDARVRRLSAKFNEHPEIETSYVRAAAVANTRYLVTTEGSSIQTSELRASVAFGGAMTAEDGTSLSRDWQVYSHAPANLPSEAELARQVDTLMEELLALHAAPQGDPYVGPALLDGRAAAVLFHEVLGHRAEGHRQKMDWEGKTFKKKVAERVMPRGFSVRDDPLIVRLNGVELNGLYEYDDQAVPARAVTIVEDGIFKEFLMSRSPIEGFESSNGHGRKQPGFRAVSRQGNLIVDPEHVTDPASLKQALLEEVGRQKLPFGIRVREVTGGETQTTAFDPQAFQVRPVLVFRVYPDGREELIRNVKLEGTPLSLLSNVVAASNDFSVFNGFCGAESGAVPVAAASPSLLVSKIELARTPKGTERPPLLPPPSAGGSKP